jgi:hypothetical protein
MAIKEVNRFAVGDVLEINLGTHENPDWIKFWDIPIRDQEEIAQAKDIVYGKGFYSKDHDPRREYRSIG